MLDFNNSKSRIEIIDQEGKALQRCNLSARSMPEDGKEHIFYHMLLSSPSSFGSKAKNLLNWCEAPTKAKQAQSSAPVGHMSVLSIRMKRGQLSINGKTTKCVVPKFTCLLTVQPLHIPGSHSSDIHIVSKNVERS